MNSIIALSDKDRESFDNYSKLYRGHKVLGLPHIMDFKAADVSETLAEIALHAYLGAVELEKHYNQIADSDKDFIPYWEQSTTFKDDITKLPVVKSRRAFVREKRWRDKIELEERDKIYSQIMHFEPFLENPNTDSLETQLNDYQLTPMQRWALRLGIPAAFGSAYMTIDLTAPEMWDFMGKVMLGISAIWFGLTLTPTRFMKNEKMEEILARPLSKHGEQADEIIKLIKTTSQGYDGPLG